MPTDDNTHGGRTRASGGDAPDSPPDSGTDSGDETAPPLERSDPGGDTETTHTESGQSNEDTTRQHHHHHDISELGVAILTVSSSRTLDLDPAGDAIADAARAAGHQIVVRELVSDTYDGVQDTVNRFVDREDTNCVITTGGTGVSPDDVTLEAVDPLLEKRLPGFGELFRTLSYDDVGTQVICTRATAGIADGVPVFCLPGSEHAAKLGTEAIILEEAGHLAGLARRETEDAP